MSVTDSLLTYTLAATLLTLTLVLILPSFYVLPLSKVVEKPFMLL